jgi:3',5'-cyclic AMP phosphodiesterase CpdA
VFITDSHIQNANTSRLAGLAGALGPDSFLLHGGDITNNGAAADIAAWRDWATGLPLPVYAALGNHDLYFDGWKQVGPVLGQSSYSLAIAARLRLIVLDSGNATLGRDQFQWLQSTLDQASEPIIVVVSHYPLFSTGFSEVDLSDPEESAALIELFGRYPVKLVLTGHIHRQSSRTIGGTLYLSGDDSMAGKSGQQAIRVSVHGDTLSTSSFTLP